MHLSCAVSASVFVCKSLVGVNKEYTRCIGVYHEERPASISHTLQIPQVKSATLLLCSQPLYVFNEIAAFSRSVGAFNGVGHRSLSPIQGVLHSQLLRAATLTAASTCEAKMLISQTVPIGITAWSAGGEG